MESNVSIGTRSFDGSESESFGVSVGPGASYFVVDGVSLYLGGTIAYDDDRGYGADESLVRNQTTTYAVGPGAGVNLWLGRFLSLYPQATAGLESVHVEEAVVRGASASTAGNPLGIPSSTRVGPYVSLHVPLLIHAAPHFFFQIGPSIFHEFGRAGGGPEIGGQRTRVSGSLGVGTWWGGPAESARSDTRPARAEPHFGDAGTLVLGGGIGGSYTTWAGTAASDADVFVAPFADYFVSEGFSVGATVRYANGHLRTIESSGARTDSSTEQFGVGPRMAFDIPIATWGSLYAQTSLTYGKAHIELKSADATLENDTTSFTFGAYAPFLVHVAPHAFIGLGPYVSRDFTREVQVTSQSSPTVAPDRGLVSRPSTSFGASLVVGGWL